ncbi:MAG: SPOR domain-containing protein [candidate division Zixibacteria bacterium]|nr:SPOR domain-containing protein [candidate division Zixibacteria bacterium]
MRRLIVQLVLGVCLIPVFVSIAVSGEIYDLIRDGNLVEAREKIDATATASRRNGTLLYYQALIESDGAQSLEYLETAFKTGMAPEYLEDNIYRMALYYLAAKDFDRLESTAQAYLQYWENGRHRSEILRLYAIACEQNRETDRADRHRERLLKECEGSRMEYLAQLDQAVRHYRNREYIKAQNVCRRLADTQYDEVVVPALYMLSFYAMEQKRVDDAILYYNLLREGYPNAVGVDDLIELFSGMQRIESTIDADRITGTTYTVQAGVFSVKDNAKRLGERLERHGQPVEIATKIISDTRYYVVYVGKFNSSDEAMAFKSRLESLENEAYQVVAR